MCSVVASVSVYTLRVGFAGRRGVMSLVSFALLSSFERAIGQEWKLHAALCTGSLNKVLAWNFTEIPVPVRNNSDSFPTTQVACALWMQIHISIKLNSFCVSFPIMGVERLVFKTGLKENVRVRRVTPNTKDMGKREQNEGTLSSASMASMGLVSFALLSHSLCLAKSISLDSES